MHKTPSNFKNLKNRRFTRLVAIKRDIDKKWPVHWICRCDCGKIKSIRADRLLDGTTKSCNCLQREIVAKHSFGQKVTKEHRLLTIIYTNYKNRAKNHNIEFSLSREELESYIYKNCYYCNSSPKNKTTVKYARDLLYNGIDRIDSKKGYTKDNIVTCCCQCNLAKLDYSLDEFKSWIEKVYNYFIKDKSVNSTC